MLPSIGVLSSELSFHTFLSLFAPKIIFARRGVSHSAWEFFLLLSCFGCGLSCKSLRSSRSEFPSPHFPVTLTNMLARESMKYVKIPYLLVIKYYWLRLLAVSAIWFIYDVSSYFQIPTWALSNLYSSQPTALASIRLLLSITSTLMAHRSRKLLDGTRL